MRTAGLFVPIRVLSSRAACSSSEDDEPSTPSATALTPPWIEEYTTDSAEPVDIEVLDLDLSEDEDAFSDLLDP